MITRRKFFSNAAVAAGAAALGRVTPSVQGAEAVGEPPKNSAEVRGAAQFEGEN
jgi:hypothetical protein